MARLALVREQITSIEKTRVERLKRTPDTGPHAMVRLLARVIGIGIETADMLVLEARLSPSHRLVDLCLKLFGCEVNTALVLGTDRRFALVGLGAATVALKRTGAKTATKEVTNKQGKLL